MEIELRAKAPLNIKEKIESINCEFISENFEYDDYFKFQDDLERKVIIRIRKKAGKEILTFKGSSKHEQDIAWQEWENEIKDSEGLKKLFLTNGLINFVTIKKQRKQYKLNNIIINIDKIEGLGNFVEAEIISENVNKAKEEIKYLLFKKLGINEKDIITEGYVPLMLKGGNKNG
jgi:adenylate cyclase, class 2